jgi:hypothetical protein
LWSLEEKQNFLWVVAAVTNPCGRVGVVPLFIVEIPINYMYEQNEMLMARKYSSFVHSMFICQLN